jgi:dethiobiotin synthetase
MNVIIAGIHTGIGKTICSAVICQALGYDYWKPVQAGDLENSDSVFIQKNVSNPNCIIHPERYRLSIPASPHYAAEQDNVEIKREDFILPKTNNGLVIETAGGIMSPLANGFLNIDLISQLNVPIVLVSNNYLGSINHTMLTINALEQKHIPILGLVYSGEVVDSTRKFIEDNTKIPLLFSIPSFEKIDATTIAAFAKTLSINL